MSSWSGVGAAVLIAAGFALFGDLPDPGASALDVYAFFLDHRDRVRIGAALMLIGLGLLAVFLTALRGRVDPARRGVGGAAMLVAGFLAVAVSSFWAAALGGLAVGAESADPESSRAVLDLAGSMGAAAGPLFALMLAGAAVALDRTRGTTPRRLALVAIAAAGGCALWLAPLLTDAAVLQSGTFFGTVLGAAGLVIWTTTTAIWAIGSPAAATQ